jgi:hypothetical protein
MVISKGMFDYSYLNNAYIGEVVSLILYALYRGYIPEIQINSNESETKNNWDWYFIQPKDLPFFCEINCENFQRVECPVVSSVFGPWCDILWNEAGADYKIWRFLYRTFIKYNDHTIAYFDRELGNFDEENTLGTIIRGTDYTATKPRWHPVQPSPDELLAILKHEFASGKYNKIYVATEEQRLYNLIEAEFGQDIVFSKQKTFYDEIYYENLKHNISRIGDVKFDRENDNYLKGIEYLLTLNALSRCSAIIGANCGGSMYAVLMSSDKCKHNILNLGVY